MEKSFSILLLFVSFYAFGQDPWKNVYTETAWVERDKWQKADELISQLNLKSGSRVADVGCHEGYLTIKLSGVVGPRGKVYAVDVEQSKLDKLQTILHKRSITNVEPIKGNYDNPKLPLNALDGVIILDTYHEMDDHDMILQHIKASLKPGGRLVLCEPIADERKKLTRVEQERKHELGINYALEDLQKAGFQIIKKQDLFVDRSKEKGDNMWLIVAVK
ncbi:methyltransferase domain-containing protein [Dolichospermum sp. ST_sed3]|nr:methyltransferase domain-containing protein [Dolichospermum sp. ST_sed3]